MLYSQETNFYFVFALFHLYSRKGIGISAKSTLYIKQIGGDILEFIRMISCRQKNVWAGVTHYQKMKPKKGTYTQRDWESHKISRGQSYLVAF